MSDIIVSWNFGKRTSFQYFSDYMHILFIKVSSGLMNHDPIAKVAFLLSVCTLNGKHNTYLYAKLPCAWAIIYLGEIRCGYLWHCCAAVGLNNQNTKDVINSKRLNADH